MKIKLTLAFLIVSLVFGACKKKSCPAYGKIKPNTETVNKTIG